MFYSLFKTPTDLFVWAIAAHLVADWLFQTEWMAIHKMNLRHPAGWVHAGVYTLFMAVIFPPLIAVLLGVIHLLVDTRTPVRWWMRVVKGASKIGPETAVVEMGVDQSIHVVTIAACVLMLVVI